MSGRGPGGLAVDKASAIPSFVTDTHGRERVPPMATLTAATKSLGVTAQGALAEELRQAEEDFANGDFIEVTIEELDRCIVAGEWPWQDEPSA